MPDNDHIKRLLYSIALDNDQVAYRELFILLHQPLRQFAYSILKSGEEAEELVSDIFLRIWQKKEELTEIDAPLLYFYTTAKNMAINRLTKQKRQAALEAKGWLVQMNQTSHDPEQIMMTEEMLQQIRKTIHELPDRCKLIYKLVKEDGLKQKEAADLLQLSVKTIEAQLAIALRRIARCMPMEIRNTIRTRISLKK
ncbi:MAG: sigma-70 family RNA polymerase sigma factor [Sediminibacterium sp.]|nr:sigma-70 family RNA polymerase sigma factor [Sediminibacterium sp.]